MYFYWKKDTFPKIQSTWQSSLGDDPTGFAYIIPWQTAWTPGFGSVAGPNIWMELRQQGNWRTTCFKKERNPKTLVYKYLNINVQTSFSKYQKTWFEKQCDRREGKIIRPGRIWFSALNSNLPSELWILVSESKSRPLPHALPTSHVHKKLSDVKALRKLPWRMVTSWNHIKALLLSVETPKQPLSKSSNSKWQCQKPKSRSVL